MSDDIVIGPSAGKRLRIVFGELGVVQENQRIRVLTEWFHDHGEWCPDVEKRYGEGVTDVPSDDNATT